MNMSDIEVIVTFGMLLMTRVGVFIPLISYRHLKLESIKDFYADYYLEDMVNLRKYLGKASGSANLMIITNMTALSGSSNFFDKRGANCIKKAICPI